MPQRRPLERAPVIYRSDLVLFTRCLDFSFIRSLKSTRQSLNTHCLAASFIQLANRRINVTAARPLAQHAAGRGS
jgi:hypothetical protein